MRIVGMVFKTRLFYLLHFLSFVFFISWVGCEKDNPYYKYEVVLTVETRAVKETDNIFFYVLVENKSSIPVFRELGNYSQTAFTRNDSIKGDKINIHLISVNTFGPKNYYKIKSFTDVPVRKKILIGEDDILQQKSIAAVNLRFNNIPDFDVVTRSAQFQQHAHTQTVFTDVPCEAIGGNTMPAGQTFYACFQKGSNAGYFFHKIPTGKPTDTISFESLNTKMLKFELPKKINNHSISKISANVNSRLFGTLQIFNLEDHSIFPSEKVDLFVPEEGLFADDFYMEFIADEQTLQYASYFYNKDIITNPTLINAEILVESDLDRNLDFSASGDYDFAEIKLAGDGSSWTFYGTNNETLYVPELPGDLTQLTGALTFLDQAETANIKLFDYSEVNNYQEALDILLDDSKEFNDTTNTFYSTVRKTIDFVNQN